MNWVINYAILLVNTQVLIVSILKIVIEEY